MDIPESNISYLIDASREEVDQKFKEITKQIEKKQKKMNKDGETSYVFVYCAGHGCADTQQYYMINSSKLTEALFPIEARLRILSKAGKGSCYVFGIYDICRTKADELKKLRDEEKRRDIEAYQNAKEEELKQLKSEEENIEARGGSVEKGTNTANLFQLWATSPEFGVAAESQLCSSLFSHLVKHSQNSRGEVHLP